MNYRIAQAVYRRTIKLTGIEVSVLHTLAGAAKDDTTLPSPSIKRLANRSGFSTGAVTKALSSLTASGILSITKRITESGQSCNVYAVHFEKLGVQKPVIESVDVKSSPSDHIATTRTLKGSPRDHIEGSQEFTKGSCGGNYNNLDNNTSNNIEKNINNTLPSKPIKDTNTVNVNGVVVEKSISILALKTDAVELLKTKGITPDDAKTRIAAVWDRFNAEGQTLKAKGYPDISNPRKYLAKMLARMASEYQAGEPTDLDGILKRVADYYKTVYSDQASRITGESILEALPPRTLDTLRAMEAENWVGVTSPVAKTKALVQPHLHRWVKTVRYDDFKEASSSLVRISNALAQRKWYLGELRRNNAPAAAIDAAAQRVEALEAKVAEVKSRIKALDAIKEAA